MVLTVLRWLGSIAVLSMIGGRSMLAEIMTVRAYWPYLLFMGLLGFTSFNALLYIAAGATSGLNLLIIQGAIPILIMLGAALFGQARIGGFQILGVVLTIIGVIITATGGRPEMLLGLKVNLGDWLMLAASLCYAAYALLLKRKPAMRPAQLLLHALRRRGARGFHRGRCRSGSGPLCMADGAGLADRWLLHRLPVAPVADFLHPRRRTDRGGAGRALRQPHSGVRRAADGCGGRAVSRQPRRGAAAGFGRRCDGRALQAALSLKITPSA